jgi:hypothetical protein
MAFKWVELLLPPLTLLESNWIKAEVFFLVVVVLALSHCCWFHLNQKIKLCAFYSLFIIIITDSISRRVSQRTIQKQPRFQLRRIKLIKIKYSPQLILTFSLPTAIFSRTWWWLIAVNHIPSTHSPPL